MPSLGDVAEDEDGPDKLSALAPDRGGTVVNRELAPVLGDEQRVVP